MVNLMIELLKINKYKKKSIFFEKDKGIYFAMNKGIKLAKVMYYYL